MHRESARSELLPPLGEVKRLIWRGDSEMGP
jgi:hypothetical protein